VQSISTIISDEKNWMAAGICFTGLLKVPDYRVFVHPSASYQNSLYKNIVWDF
jgi:hypothetical protein